MDLWFSGHSNPLSVLLEVTELPFVIQKIICCHEMPDELARKAIHWVSPAFRSLRRVLNFAESAGENAPRVEVFDVVRLGMVNCLCQQGAVSLEEVGA